jgi:inner membrane protein
VENITHSLVGAAIAELALPRNATPTQRRVFFTVGIIAANLPDADLLYTHIMPSPLGYLLHHRGYTHTLGGLVILAALIGVVMLAPRLRATIAGVSGRFWALVAAALLSHVVLDSWNSYGVHPFWPINSSWYYGDAIAIYEPWLWVFLGLAVGANTRNARARSMLLGLPVVLVLAAALLHLIQWPAVVALLVASALIAFVGRNWTARARSVGALAATTAFVVASYMLSHAAYASAAESLGPDGRAALVDMALSPRPAQPLCWSTLTVEKHEVSHEYSLRRGYVNLAPSAFAWLGCGVPRGAGWTGGQRQILPQLRDLVANDCYVRAWMQFARAPAINDSVMVDARFGSPRGGGFTEIFTQPEGRACPAHMTHWEMPRADLLRER